MNEYDLIEIIYEGIDKYTENEQEAFVVINDLINTIKEDSSWLIEELEYLKRDIYSSSGAYICSNCGAKLKSKKDNSFYDGYEVNDETSYCPICGEEY